MEHARLRLGRPTLEAPERPHDGGPATRPGWPVDHDARKPVAVHLKGNTLAGREGHLLQPKRASRMPRPGPVTIWTSAAMK